MVLSGKQAYHFQAPCSGENDFHWVHLIGLDTMEVGARQDVGCSNCGHIYIFIMRADGLKYTPKGERCFWPEALQAQFEEGEEKEVIFPRRTRTVPNLLETMFALAPDN